MRWPCSSGGRRRSSVWSRRTRWKACGCRRAPRVCRRRCSPDGPIFDGPRQIWLPPTPTSASRGRRSIRISASPRRAAIRAGPLDAARPDQRHLRPIGRARPHRSSRRPADRRAGRHARPLRRAARDLSRHRPGGARRCGECASAVKYLAEVERAQQEAVAQSRAPMRSRSSSSAPGRSTSSPCSRRSAACFSPATRSCRRGSRDCRRRSASTARWAAAGASSQPTPVGRRSDLHRQRDTIVAGVGGALETAVAAADRVYGGEGVAAAGCGQSRNSAAAGPA